MSITLNTKAFELDATVDANQNRYVGPSHTISDNDLLALSRRKSGTSATSPGVARSVAKFTRTITIDGKKYDAIAEANFAIPVGMLKADVDALRDDLGDLLVSANGENLVWKHDINQ